MITCQFEVPLGWISSLKLIFIVTAGTKTTERKGSHAQSLGTTGKPNAVILRVSQVH